jgi:hypothetical protein
MTHASRNHGGDGRARRRTTPGRAYQVHTRTAQPPDASDVPRAPGGTGGESADRPYDRDVVPERCRRSPARRRRAVFVLAIVALIATGCSGARFDPTGPCTVDGRAAGAYPELERQIPSTFDEVAPTALDSGRSCSPTALGSLASHHVGELRFAGAQWHLGDRSGVTMAALSSPTGLDAEWVGEFYESSARVARHTENVSAGQTRVGGVDAFRIETLNDETSFQTVVVWPGKEVVDVVLVASDVHEIGSRAAHDEIVDRAVAALARFSSG